jgi:hypothetical protein
MRIGDRLFYPVEYFDGGKNNRYSDNILADNESPDCLNVETDALGDVSTRRGSLCASNSSTTGSLLTGIWYGIRKLENTSGISSLVGWYNSSMVEASAGSFTTFGSGSLSFVTVPSAEDIFSGQTYVAHTVYQNKVLMSDGNTPYKYDGSEFTRLGIETPSNTLAATTATTAGLLGSGVYQYKVGYVNSGVVEGDVSTTALTFTAPVSSIVSLTGLPIAPKSFGVARRFLYRTKKDDDSIFYFLDEIADNTTTTYKDNIPDSDLIEQAPIDQGYPPNFRLVQNHKDRIWAVEANSARMRYSEIGRPELWPAENEELIGDGAGFIKALAVHQDAILTIKNDGTVHLLFLADNDPNNFIPIKINAPYGTVSRFTATYNDSIMYLGTIGNRAYGFVGLSGAQVINESITTDDGVTASNVISDRITPDIENLEPTLLGGIQGIAYRNKVFIALPYLGLTGIAAENNTIYQFDYQRRTTPNQIGAWFPFSGLYAAYFEVFKDRLLYVPPGERSQGYVFELDVQDRYADDTFDDEGVFSKSMAIDSYFYTKRFACQKQVAQNHKDFRTATLYLGLLGTYNMDMYTRIDLDNGSGELSTIDLNPGGTYWGQFNWGLATWGGADLEGEIDVDLGTLSGRRIQFKFTNQNTAHQAFSVKRLSIEYTLRPRRRYLG